MKNTIGLFFTLMLVAVFSSTAANTQIQNNYMKVSYSSVTRSITSYSIAEKYSFVREGFLEGAGMHSETIALNSDKFGKGQGMIISGLDGGSIRLELYENIPFLFVRTTIKNTGSQTMDIRSLIPYRFNIRLDVPISKIKTLGTGGLLAPSECSGSYMFLTTVNPENRNAVVAGWISNEKGSGVIIPKQGANNEVEISSKIDYGHLRLASNESEALETFVIGYFEDGRIGQEQYAALVAKNLDIKMADRSAVFCTWYCEKNGGAANEKAMVELSSFIEKNLKDYGMGAIQIDDQWQDGGKYNGPTRAFDRVRKNGPYPNGFDLTVSSMRQAGLGAGIWWMPFSRNHQDPEYANRQDWFVKHVNGQPFLTSWGGSSLDLTYPPVQKHIQETALWLKKWGFNYFKMDGLWTGTATNQVYINDGYLEDSIGNIQALYNPKKTQIEAYRDGLRLLRNTVGKDVFFSGCCASQNMRSFGGSFGLVDAMRIGPDFNHDGQSYKTGIIRASRLYFLNGKVWWNDPDPCIVRASGVGQADAGCKGVASLDLARVLPSWVAVTTSFYLSSDWLPDLGAERLDILKRTMKAHKGQARPIDIFDSSLPSMWLASDNSSGVNRQVLALFNFTKSSRKIQASFGKADLDSSKTYYAFDYWANQYLGEISKNFAYDVTADNCKIIALRAKEGHPVVLSSSQHVMQGMVDIKKELWQTNKLIGQSELVAGDVYELRIAGMKDGKNWELSKARILDDKDAVIRQVESKEEGILRIQISAKKTKLYNWELRFK